MAENATVKWLLKKFTPKIDKLQEEYDTEGTTPGRRGAITREMNSMWALIEQQRRFK